jgi:hypothetical protein
LVIFNDCCIHVLKLPDDGSYVTEKCSEIKGLIIEHLIKDTFVVATVNLIIITYCNTQQDAHYEDCGIEALRFASSP